MSHRLDVNWDAIEAMYIYSPQKMSIAEITKKCKQKGIQVSQGSIGNKAKEKKWVKKREEYWNKINRKVEKRVTTEITKQRTNNIKIIDATIQLGAKNLLMKLKKNQDFSLSAGDLDKLMRLREFLLGHADSRQERRLILDKPLSEMSDEELEEVKEKVLSAEDVVYEVLDEEEG